MSEFFLRPYLVVLLLLAVPIVYAWARRQITIRHSSLEPHKRLKGGSALVIAGCIFLTGMTASLDLAIMGPKVPNAVVEHKALIRKVCVATDRSGSMDTELEDGAKELADDEAKSKNGVVDNGPAGRLILNEGESKEVDENARKLKRIEGAQLAARYIIRNRMTDNPATTDHFCLMTFDDDTYMLAPLSNDKQVLLKRTVHILKTGGGTNFAGPYGYTSGIGPLQKAVDYFADNAGANSTAVLILVTDGEDSIPEERRKQLVELFAKQRLHFYVIGVGDGWKNSENLDLQKFADELRAQSPNNGHVFKAANPGEMRKAMEKINELEKAQEIVETRQEYKEIYGWFLLAAGIFGVLFIGAAVLARRVP